MSSIRTSVQSSAASPVLPIMAVVFVAFFVTGIALPVLPLHVHNDLGFGTFAVGLVTGSQFVAALVTRVGAGHFSDRRGAKQAVQRGLFVAAVSGALFLLSLAFEHTPTACICVLLAGRGLLGGAESFIITGALSWGLSLVPPSMAGRVIAWVGTAMYAAFALGAPAGSMLYAHFGFEAIAVLTILMPIVTLLVVAPLPAVPPRHREQTSITGVLKTVARPGIGLAMSSIAFGAMTAFATLLFAERGWQPTWLPFSLFAAAFILARVCLGHLPDRLGGARVAMAFVVIEALGQVLIWFAPHVSIALLGAVLTGFGYSLVYPALGVEAVRRVFAHNRGLAMGAYTAFLDLALGVSTPALGLVAHWTDMGDVFLIAAVSCIGCAVIASTLRSEFHEHL